MPRTRPFARRDGGQILIATALLIPVLLGMAALAVDIGAYADDKRNLQNAADAIALAAASEMCTPNPADCSNTTAARATAITYASKNSVAFDATNDLTFLGGNSAPKVRVALSKGHTFAFARIFGVNSRDVGVAAAAVKVSPGSLSGLMPWGVTQDTIDAVSSGDLTTIKNGAGSSTTGNFGIIAYDGTGASVYKDTIERGSQGSVCSQGTANCVPTADQCPPADVDMCYTKPGNVVGPTDSGVADRIANTSSACSSFSDAFSPVSASANESQSSELALAGAYRRAAGRLFSPAVAPNAKQPTSTPTPPSTPSSGGMYALNPNCNPWAGPGACPKPDDGVTPCSRRVIVIPIIDQLPNGRKEVTILGFAMFFLEGSSGGVVSGRFVQADVNFGSLAGVYNPSSTLQYAKLVE
ncbi:MAG: hypothetical protein IVW36_08045 [Dehalococcoidia bacterium]|nr:hypothetical protein [Dehalococcoidia bacterium]